ncbi:MAG: hypothetical protein H6R01_969 [Burkholderiaceae bacterium]|nr:hypothetical protein [Burkholderiaceae bacterium]
MRIASHRIGENFLRVWLALVAFVCLLAFSGQAQAARTINSLTLNGSSSVDVLPGDSITVQVNLRTTSGDWWQSTAMRIGSGSWVCFYSPSVKTNTTTTASFAITAPASVGTYDLEFRAYDDVNCNVGWYGYTSKTYSAAIVVSEPTVTSITRASGNPSAPNTSVSWTVVFNRAVSGVDASDFSLVPSAGISGASITSVSGSGTTWTVTANTGGASASGGTLGLNLVDDDSIVDASGRKLGGTGSGNGNFTGEVYAIEPGCVAPAGSPAGLTCVCDNFNRATLNPSPIFNSNWIVSRSGSDTTGKDPSIVNSGLMRLTDNTQNNAKAATVPGIFPAKGNYISVEFRHYAYAGNSADGIAVTLSDYAVPPVPGAYGGSLGYAQKTGIPGFAGGWIGVGIDEYGNYQNPTEGRVGGPGARPQSVAVRGSGSGTNNYRWLAGTTVSPRVDSPSPNTSAAPGYRYQVIVDARNDPTSTSVYVNRDTGSGYASLFSLPNVYASGTQVAVPDNWQISFTGSTGTNYNYHEIGSVRICASNISPPGGGTATGFNAIDEAYPQVLQNFQSGHIYMKVAGLPFMLSVAALDNNQIVTTYAATGNKNVTVKLVDNSDGVCVLDNNQANYCSTACQNKSAVAGGSQTLTFTQTDRGIKQSGNFTINQAYKNLAAIISDGTVTACSTDSFAVRPSGMTATTSANNTGTNGTPKFKAGTDAFSITVTANAGNYTGTPKINDADGVLSALAPATVAGKVSNVFPAAVNSVSTGSDFRYSEVGNFKLPGYAPTGEGDVRLRGIYDDDWTVVDGISTKNDCIARSFSNVKDASGKYGCSFGTVSDTTFGRFIPDHFTLLDGSTVTPACGTAPNAFSYMGQTFGKLSFSIEARNGGNGITKNYADTLATGVVSMVAENNNAGADLGARLDSIPAASWVAGAYTVNTDKATFSRAAAPDGAYDALQIGVKVTDPDGPLLDGRTMNAETTAACEATNTCDSKQIGETTRVRFGRLRLTNAYGSERLNLPIPMRAEYFNGTTFVTNTLDNCTAVAAENVAMPAYKGGVTGSNMTVAKNATAGGTFASGVGRLVLSPPNPKATTKGSVDVCVDLGADTPVTPARCVAATPLNLPWLKGRWTGGGYDDDPISRATFGVYKNSLGRGSEMIYFREMY